MDKYFYFLNKTRRWEAAKCICFKFKFLINFDASETVVVAQLVRASDCDSEGRGFEPHHPPK